MTKPLVTIGIPTYNRADSYLGEALSSALAQDYAPLEILVSDNASTDGTKERVREMADDRVTYLLHESNIGGKANFDACLERARGEYFLLLHDDDRIDPGFVSACMAALATAPEGPPVGMIRTGTRVIDAGGRVVSQRRNDARTASAGDLMAAWFARRTSLYFASTLFRTGALREVGGFDTPHGLYIDVAAAIRIAARWRVLDVPDVLASFRRHGGNSGGLSAIEAWVEDSHYLLDVLCELEPERAAELRQRGLRYFTTNNYSRVRRLSGAGQRVDAYALVYRAFGRQTPPWRYAVRRLLVAWRDALRHRAA